jgi:hypothetical protein
MNPLGQHTLDYLFRDLLPKEGFSPTFDFIRDRSRSVRNDFTMQHETGALAMECHERCARFHILALHLERDRQGFSIAMEEQQLMNSEIIIFPFFSASGSNPKVSPTKSQRVLRGPASPLRITKRARDAHLSSPHPYPRPTRTSRRSSACYSQPPSFPLDYKIPPACSSQVLTNNQIIAVSSP